MELKNQPINKRVHKTLCINFRACAAFFPKVMYISLLDRNDVFKWVAVVNLNKICLRSHGHSTPLE